MSETATRWKALALVTPLFLFLAVFFLWPLWMMISVAVRDDAVSSSLPRTAAAIGSWNGEGEPEAEVEAALLADLRSAGAAVLGPAVRRLNAEVSGFRTLISKTTTAAKADMGPPLRDIDPRWADPRVWMAIRNATSAYTDRNLLAAIDLQRDASGAVASLPATLAGVAVC